MKYLILALSLGAIILGGCSIEDKYNPIISSKINGKIQLKIDKVNAPEDVVAIEAILSRDGFESIVGALNLLSDSTADILLDEIPAGIWHLKVDAIDDEGAILYTGETEVEIFAGFVTQVNLVLNPTGEGTGSIYIYVTWGAQTNSIWIDFLSNPVLISSNNYYDQRGIAQPEIIYENNQFKMWYYGEEGAGVKYVLYAESNDGINWERPINEPVLSPGPQGSWDSWAVHPGAILKDGDIYKMCYVGWANTYGQWNIGLAISIDGISWEKYPQPILYGTSGWEFQIGASSIIKFDGMYYLYYYGRNLPDLKIGLATSTDGENWERYPGNPILSNTEPWEENGVYYATVVRENNQFKMVYMNSVGTGFGFAYSPDGINWTKDNSNPFFTRENTSNNWANYKIAYPSFVKTGNDTRIYYSGLGSTGEFFKIGFVRNFGND